MSADDTARSQSGHDDGGGGGGPGAPTPLSALEVWLALSKHSHGRF